MLQTREISVDKLHPNPWNTNEVDLENEIKIENAIKKFGFFKPVLVRERDDGELEIIGGEHRIKVAQRLGYETIPTVNLGKIDDKKAKEIGLVDNGRYGSDNAVGLAKLLTELGGADEVIDFLPYTDADLTNIFASTDIDLDDLEFDEEDALPVEEIESAEKPIKTHTILQFKFTIEDAEKVSDLIKKTQNDQGFAGSDTKTNAGDALYHLLFAEADIE